MSRKRRGRGEGSVHQRADGLWVASVSLGCDENGKRKRKVVYGASKAEVREKLLSTQTASSAGQLCDADNLTVGGFLGRWVETVKPKVQPNTWVPYDRHVRLHLVPRIGQLRLAKLSAFHVEQLYRRMEEEGVSAALRKKVGTTLGTALRHAVRLKLVPHNVAADISKPRASKPEVQVYDPDQVSRLLKAARENRLHALYVVAIDAGMRQGELLAIHWPDIDFTAGVSSSVGPWSKSVACSA